MAKIIKLTLALSLISQNTKVRRSQQLYYAHAVFQHPLFTPSSPLLNPSITPFHPLSVRNDKFRFGIGFVPTHV